MNAQQSKHYVGYTIEQVGAVIEAILTSSGPRGKRITFTPAFIAGEPDVLAAFSESLSVTTHLQVGQLLEQMAKDGFLERWGRRYYKLRLEHA